MKHFLVLVSILLLAFKPSDDEAVTIWLIGDSTMADKLMSKYPETGWGTPFKNYFNNKVLIENRAKNGRSTRTFLAEGLWENVYKSLGTKDYVFIQFGHNDEAKEEKYKDRYTSPVDYEKNLNLLIDQTIEKGATPVLLTPVSRRYFNEKGEIKQTHIPYSDIVRKVAKQKNVNCIDLDEMSRDLYQRLGDETSKLLFLNLKPHQNPNYPNGVEDNTHFNEYGARLIAELVLKEIKNQHLRLENYIN